jgi:hypothetical protein
MDKLEKRITFVLVMLGVCLVGMLVFGPDQTLWGRNREKEPFDQTRVATVRIVMAEKDWEWICSNPRAEQYVRADFWYDEQKIGNVAVRPKGNSSLMTVSGSGSKRMSLKIDFNFFNSAQNFRGLRKLCLNNGFSDPSFMREVLGYELFSEMGLPCPRTAFVDVYVNDLHLGLYTQVEPIDKVFLQRHFANAEGNLYKPQIGAALLNWTEADVIARRENSPQPTQPTQPNVLALNIGGSRLGDLLRLMERERTGNPVNTEGGNPFGGPGGMPGGFGGGMPGGMPGGFGGPDGQGMPAMPVGPEGFARGGNRPPMGGGMQGQPMAGPGGGVPDTNRPAPGGIGPDGLDRGGQGNRQFGGRGGGMGGGFGGGPGGFGGFGGRGGDLLETVALRTNDNYPNHTALFHFLEVLNKCPDETFPTEIEKVLDVDQVLRYLAVSSMLVHLDNYTGMGHNYYLYEINGYFTILPWDLNMAFGGFRMGVTGGDIAEFYIDEPVTNGMETRPLVNRLLAYPPYKERYHQYHEEMLAGGFAEGILESRIERWATLIRAYVEKDELKFFTMEQFEKGLTDGSGEMGGFMGMGMPGPGAMNTGADRRPEMAMGMPPGGMAGLTPGPVEEAPIAGGEQNRQMRPGPQGPQGPQGQQGQQGRQGRGMRGFGGGPGGGGMGMGAPGLQSFIAKRRTSVRGQLDGTLPSKPTEAQRQQGMPFMPMMPGGMPR